MRDGRAGAIRNPPGCQDPTPADSPALPSPVLEVTFCLGSLLSGSEAAEVSDALQQPAQEDELKIKHMPEAMRNPRFEPGSSRDGQGVAGNRSPILLGPLPAQPVPSDHPTAPFAPGWALDRLCLLQPGTAPARSLQYLPTPTLCSLEDMIISQITKHQEQLCNLPGSLLHLLILKYFNGSFIAVLKSSERQ